MSDAPTDPFSISSSIIFGRETRRIKGAEWQIECLTWPAPASFTVKFNSGMFSRDCEAHASIVIEIGVEGDIYYSSHSFDVVFNDASRMENFSCADGRVFRNWKEASNVFKNSELDDGKLYTFTLTVHSVKGPKYHSFPVLNLQDPNISHDKVLLMDDGTRFYVQSQYLCHASEFFNRMLTSDFAESRKEEIAIRDVDSRTFAKMLKFIYPCCVEDLRMSSLVSLLHIADRFDIPFLTRKCIDVVLRLEKTEAERWVVKIMEWSDIYQLLELQEFAFKTLIRAVSIRKQIQKRKSFKRLPVCTREKVLYALSLQEEKK